MIIEEAKWRLKLRELREERDERNPKGWGDYMWQLREGDIVKGKIEILEEMLNERLG